MDSFKKFFQGQLTTAAAVLYTVPPTKSAIIKHMHIANPTGADRSFTLWRDGSADSNLLYPGIPIKGGGWAEWDGSMALGAGESIFGKADVALALTLTIDGDEVT